MVHRATLTVLSNHGKPHFSIVRAYLDDPSGSLVPSPPSPCFVGFSERFS